MTTKFVEEKFIKVSLRITLPLGNLSFCYLLDKLYFQFVPSSSYQGEEMTLELFGGDFSMPISHVTVVLCLVRVRYIIYVRQTSLGFWR